MKWGSASDAAPGGPWLGPRAFVLGLVAITAFVLVCAVAGVGVR